MEIAQGEIYEKRRRSDVVRSTRIACGATVIERDAGKAVVVSAGVIIDNATGQGAPSDRTSAAGISTRPGHIIANDGAIVRRGVVEPATTRDRRIADDQRTVHGAIREASTPTRGIAANQAIIHHATIRPAAITGG